VVGVGGGGGVGWVVLGGGGWAGVWGADLHLPPVAASFPLSLRDVSKL